MKYAAETDSGATIYVPSFIKIGSDTQKVIGVGTHTHTHTHNIHTNSKVISQA
jgi:hypothetical protein